MILKLPITLIENAYYFKRFSVKMGSTKVGELTLSKAFPPCDLKATHIILTQEE